MHTGTFAQGPMHTAVGVAPFHLTFSEGKGPHTTQLCLPPGLPPNQLPVWEVTLLSVILCKGQG